MIDTEMKLFQFVPFNKANTENVELTNGARICPLEKGRTTCTCKYNYRKRTYFNDNRSISTINFSISLSTPSVSFDLIGEPIT